MTSVTDILERRRKQRTPRLRSKSQLAHNPSGHGKGRWTNKKTLWASKMKARRLRRISEASRKANHS